MKIRMIRLRGFTLIEIMIAIAVVAILETLTVASYRVYITKARRNYAEQQLLQNVQYMERYNAQNGAYATGSTLAYPAVPYTRSPETGGQMYSINFVGTVTANNYTLMARPMCASSQKDDGCICADKDGTITENAAACNGVACACQ
jgi:type IV pilus assembly protein PilE